MTMAQYDDDDDEEEEEEEVPISFNVQQVGDLFSHSIRNYW